MAEEAQAPENQEEELLLTEEAEQQAPPAPEADEEEEILTFDDELTDEKADDSNLVKHLREQIRKRDKELAETRKSSQPEPEIEIGPEPTLEDCEYDGERYKAELREYDQRVAAVEAKKAERHKATEDEAKRWQEQLARVEREKQALNRADAEEAFDTVRAALNQNQQAALVEATDGNTAKIVYALSKNPERLTALAGETNLVRFIKEVAKLEGQLKTMKRRKAPEPDVPQRPSGKASVTPNAAQKQLEKMEAEWKGGDRSHIIAFKREHGLK